MAQSMDRIWPLQSTCSKYKQCFHHINWLKQMYVVQPGFAGDLFGKWCVGTLSSWDGSSKNCDKLKISDRSFKGQEAKKHRTSISK